MACISTLANGARDKRSTTTTLFRDALKKTGLFSDIDQKGG